MSSLISGILPRIPSQEELIGMLPYFAVFLLALIGMGLLGRVFLGKRSNLNHCFSSAMAVLFIYITTIAVYAFHPWNLSRFLSPLPLITLAGNTLVFFPFHGTSLPLICTQILPLLILCFLVNLLDTFMPQGESPVSWILFRILTVILSMGLHLLCSWAFNTYLPEVLVTYAPMILLGVLAATLLVGLVSILLGLSVATVNPILGALCTFFFSNVLGKQLSKAVLTTTLLCLLFVALEHFGFYAIDISTASLIGYLPAAALVILLWYLLGSVL